MLDEEKCCSDILIQVSAVKAAINKVGILIFEEHSRQCLKQAMNTEDDASVDDLITLMNRFVGLNISTVDTVQD